MTHPKTHLFNIGDTVAFEHVQTRTQHPSTVHAVIQSIEFVHHPNWPVLYHLAGWKQPREESKLTKVQTDPAADKPYDTFWSRRALAAEKLLANLLATCPHEMEGAPRLSAALDARTHLETFSK